MPTIKKAYCFTLNNYTDVEQQAIYRVCEAESRYAIVGLEVGPRCGTPHLQGYIIFKRAYRFDTIKDRLLPRCHIEIAAGSVHSNWVYCTKDRSFREFGEKPSSANSRDELARLFVQRAGQGVAGLVEFSAEHPGTWFYSGHNLLRNYISTVRPIERPNIKAQWFYGEPGTGKSRRAHEEMPEAYVKEPRTKWWNGYMFETDVIIDDFGPQGIDINHLLRWFDRYKCLVEYKGGMIPLFACNFIITSNFTPDKLFSFGGECNPQLPALMRRIKLVSFPYSFMYCSERSERSRNRA